jgi:hypothetical protein
MFNSDSLANFVTGLVVKDAQAALMLEYPAVTEELISSFPLIYRGRAKYGYVNDGYLHNMSAWYEAASAAYIIARREGVISDNRFDRVR